ncbi:MAG: response regulator transcription factor [Pseudomonadota bacterium]
METTPLGDAGKASSSASSCLPLARVLIVDDHPFFLLGLSAILEQEGLVTEAVAAASVAEAVSDLQRRPETSLVLLDLTLQGEAGLSLFSELERVGLPVPVVVISSREDETSVRAARAAGAVGFLPKSAGRRSLLRMLRRVSDGLLYYPSLQTPPRAPDHLTPRQLEVLALLAEGLPNKRICQELNLTEHTVKTHLKAIFVHLGVHNRTECVAQARSLGLI